MLSAVVAGQDPAGSPANGDYRLVTMYVTMENRQIAEANQMSESLFDGHSSSLRLTAEPKALARIRRFVQESSEAFGVTPADVPGVLLAVDEAVTNIIVHGYAGRGGPVEIEISRSPGALVIRLRDEARPFDPTGAPAPDLAVPLEERTPGRLGIHLIRQVMNELIYRRHPDGRNELTMMKKVP